MCSPILGGWHDDNSHVMGQAKFLAEKENAEKILFEPSALLWKTQ